VALDGRQHEILGTLSAGGVGGGGVAAEVKKMTGSDVAFGMDGQILASTLPREQHPVLADRLRTIGITRVLLGGEEYEALPRPLTANGDATGAPSTGGPVAVILRSRTAQLQSLGTIHAGLLVTAVFAVLIATALSFTVSRTTAQRLAAITDEKRDVSATGDLTRKT